MSLRALLLSKVDIRHAGDLGDITFDSNGVTEVTLSTASTSLSPLSTIRARLSAPYVPAQPVPMPISPLPTVLMPSRENTSFPSSKRRAGHIKTKKPNLIRSEELHGRRRTASRRAPMHHQGPTHRQALTRRRIPMRPNPTYPNMLLTPPTHPLQVGSTLRPVGTRRPPAFLEEAEHMRGMSTYRYQFALDFDNLGTVTAEARMVRVPPQLQTRPSYGRA